MPRNRSARGRCSGGWLVAGLLLVSLAAPARGAGQGVLPCGTLPSHRLVPGERSVFAVDYRSVSVTDLGALFRSGGGGAGSPGKDGSRQTVESRFRGRMEITVQDSVAEGTRVLCRSVDSSLTLTSGGKDSSSSARSVREDLARPFLALLSPRGRVEKVWLDPSLSPLSRGFATTLLSLTQFVVPAPADASSRWEAEEEDPSGAFVARYESRRDGKGGNSTAAGTYRKTRVRYLPVRVARKRGEYSILKTIVPKGSLTLGYDLRNGRLDSVKGEESATVVLGGKNVGSARTVISLRRVETVTATAPELAALREQAATSASSGPGVSLSKAQPEDRAEDNFHRQRLGTENLKSLLAALKALEGSPDPQAGSAELSLKFEALVHLHPDSAAPLGEVLSSPDVPRRTLLLLSAALGSAGSPQAQEALEVAVRGHKGDRDTLLVLIPVLGRVENPIPQAENLLRGIALLQNSGLSPPVEDRSVAPAAMLALGTMARSLREVSPARSEKIVADLLAALDAGSNAGGAETPLLALGNAGSRSSLPALAPRLSDSSAATRAYAVRALRWIPGGDIDTLLAKALDGDADAGVRKQALEAMAVREMNRTLFMAQRAALQKDTSADMRAGAMKSLWNVRDRFPEARSLLKKAAKDDPSPEIRRSAANLLQKVPKRSLPPGP